MNDLPAFARADETSQSLEWRVRSYLAVNCVQCHQPGGASQGNWDARHTTPTDSANLINGLLVNDAGDSANRFAVPGDTAHSMLLKRQQGNGVTRMPPLATNERDLVAEQLVTDWIASLTTRQSLADWQTTNFGSTGSPDAATTADPDGDGRSNGMEFLTGTDPNAGESFWTYGQTSAVSGTVQIEFTQPANRSAIVEASGDLVNWHSWDAPGNTPTFPATATTRTIITSAASADRFFRVRFSEP